MRPLDERGAWAAKSKKEYDLDENGERIRLPSGKYKARKVDLTGLERQGQRAFMAQGMADISNAYLERAGSPERIDHRSNAERGIDELPTVHMGVAACQMEKKGIATEKGELNGISKKQTALSGKSGRRLESSKNGLANCSRRGKPPGAAPAIPRPCKSADEVFKRSERKEPEVFAELAKAAHRRRTENRCKGGQLSFRAWHFTLDELDAALSSVSDQADAIREGMKTAEKRMKELQKLIEYGKNYTEYKPIHDELKKLKNGWTSKRDKYEEAHRAELTLWNAASRYLHANLPKGTKTLPISEWEKEYATLSGQRTAEYTKLKETRAEVAELHNIRKCVDIALKADQPEQEPRAKRHDLER